MHVGEPVAMVVAETRAAALDAADLVQVDYEELPAVVDLETAMKGKTQLYPEAPGNLCIDWPGPVADGGSATHDGVTRCAIRRLRSAAVRPRNRGLGSSDTSRKGSAGAAFCVPTRPMIP